MVCSRGLNKHRSREKSFESQGEGSQTLAKSPTLFSTETQHIKHIAPYAAPTLHPTPKLNFWRAFSSSSSIMSITELLEVIHAAVGSRSS